jgi:hypothetical protein
VFRKILTNDGVSKDGEIKKVFQGKKIKWATFLSQNGQGHKFTWRYDIQIDNDKDFQVSKKLIGAKGTNMFQIIESCKAIGESLEKEGMGKIKVQDLVKLRLRGRGSGFKEGPRQEESGEPLHLWVSSKYFRTYKKACELAENLIGNVYEQYYKYQTSRNVKFEKLKVRKHENTYTRKNSGSSNSSKTAKKKHNRNQSQSNNGTYDISKYPPISTTSGEILNKSKFKSDSKKQYNQSLLFSNFDSYGFYDGGMMPQAFMPPQYLVRNTKSYHFNKPGFQGRKLFSESNQKASGIEYYPTIPKPDFN